MVHFAGGREFEMTPFGFEFPVKLEVEDFLEDEHASFNKRMKHSPYPDHGLSADNDLYTVSPSQYNVNPLDEPSPLGLRLRKSPSLLELIQTALSQGNASKLESGPSGDSAKVLKEKNTTIMGSSGTVDKLKAANFPASLLKIGGWEYASRYGGDLVAKCYFSKHKLVWEILDGGLKSKIEIQWSDIMGLKANISEDGPTTLTVVLARQPLFFRETNPQPRKHTLWQATADFTDGHASIHRQHFLQVSHGLLNKHFEKLIQCDARLNFLSRQPEIILDSPYFDARGPVLTHSDEAENLGLDPSISSFRDVASPTISQSSCITFNFKQEDIISSTTDCVSCEAPSPSSGNCIPGQASSQAPSITEEGFESCEVLKDLAQYLLSDSQLTTCSDETSLLSRVDSLCCLPQDTISAKSMQFTQENNFVEPEWGNSPALSFYGMEVVHQNDAGLGGAFLPWGWA
ncbi:hypothetical protein Dimus_002472 [Dionaea muscipula]